MPAILEAVVFSHFITSFEVYERLVDLDERIVLRWLAPGKPGAKELGPPDSTKHRVWVRPKNSTNVRILGGGHLVRFGFFFFFLPIRSLHNNNTTTTTDSSRSATRVRYVFFFLFFVLFSDPE